MGGHAGRSKNITFRDIWVNADFGPTVGWTVLQGRDFSRAYGTDSTSAIVNEEGARILGFKDPGPIGKTVIHSGKPYTIIGVTKNMLVNNPYDKIQPAILPGRRRPLHQYHPHQTRHARPHRPGHDRIRLQKVQPGQPFLYSFNDEAMSENSSPRPRSANLATVFSGLAILISCLGLFGLASFVSGTTHKRDRRPQGPRRPRRQSLGRSSPATSSSSVILSCLVSHAAIVFLHEQVAAKLYASHLPIPMDLRRRRRRYPLDHPRHRQLSSPQSSPDESRQKSPHRMILTLDL